MASDCLFCGIIAGEVSAPRVYEDAEAVAFLDHRPLFPGHVLVVPRERAQDVKKAVEMIAEEKRITFEQAAHAVVANTKRYFGIENAGKPKLTLMRN